MNEGETLVGLGPTSSIRGASLAPVRELTRQLPGHDVDSELQQSLDELVEDRLVQNRRRKTADAEGLFSNYRATALGGGLVERGVAELACR